MNMKRYELGKWLEHSGLWLRQYAI